MLALDSVASDVYGREIALGTVTFAFVVAIALAILAFFARQEALKQEAKAKA